MDFQTDNHTVALILFVPHRPLDLWLFQIPKKSHVRLALQRGIEISTVVFLI